MGTNSSIVSICLNFVSVYSMYIANAVPNHFVDLTDYTQISFVARSLIYTLVARLSFLNSESLIDKVLLQLQFLELSMEYGYYIY